MSEAIRLLIVDDHAIVRRGMKALLTEIDGIVVVGEADDGAEAMTQATALEPDVILMDLVMPEVDGIEAIRQISASHPDIAILALTSFASDDKVFPAIKAGALGYMLKNADLEELVAAIRQVHNGEPSLHPNIARKVLRELRQPQNERAPAPEQLTPRELDVLQLIAKGMSNQEIADHLVVAEPTVRTHVSRILDKLHLANRVQATLYAMREGLTSLDVDPD
ncbi:response regulator transcription factor [Chloroflexi bacterium TSY]|nr:response regulator transcription factor [Chloroflexi bacterium TSY]